MNDVLEEARRACDGDRADDYGPPDKSFKRIAAMWSNVLGVEVTPRKVALCLISLKLVRDSHRPKHDNLVDIAGYVRCIQAMEQGVS